ncbi:MAG: SPOR domain-containing protein [Candidatus Cloacimonadales bacterium]|nr:SPOR domain-containing protein [Candidatus Cloacimonadota bacterium]MDD2649566.1 SPOR domain-containing protein [Candidatus Cloacimonadota bacterium]MDD3501827.1 SPOR domain-containing protein [Candidatus Cloacimonadota bacterium]MDX9977679.1 SPOR domain-containing protein [Candidatus Cloacimonadales bacterium]
MKRKIFVLIFTCFASSFIFGATIPGIENAYLDGSLNSNHAMLIQSSADPASLSACKLYYTAKLNANINNSIAIYEQAYKKDKQSKYGQLASLELAKIDFIHRDFEQSLEKLKDLNLINESHYWKARSYFQLKKYPQAIVSVENYLQTEPNGVFSLDLNCLLLDIYLLQEKRSEFLTVKQKLEKYSNYNDFEAYALYKEGLLYSLEEDFDKAIICMRTVVQKHPLSQYRVYADDLILEYNKKTPTVVKAQAPAEPAEVIQPENPKMSDTDIPNFANMEKGKPFLQYGLFSTKLAATNYQKQLSTRGVNTFVVIKIVSNKEHYAVIQGPFTSRESASAFLSNVKSNNISAFMLFP